MTNWYKLRTAVRYNVPENKKAINRSRKNKVPR